VIRLQGKNEHQVNDWYCNGQLRLYHCHINGRCLCNINEINNLHDDVMDEMGVFRTVADDTWERIVMFPLVQNYVHGTPGPPGDKGLRSWTPGEMGEPGPDGALEGQDHQEEMEKRAWTTRTERPTGQETTRFARSGWKQRCDGEPGEQGMEGRRGNDGRKGNDGRPGAALVGLVYQTRCSLLPCHHEVQLT
ncbi:Uncharacterized protein BM_BM17254, partial [Brugia malayi]